MRRLTLPPILRSLSARVLVLTISFVMISEIAIFVPSIARNRLTYLENKISTARLAVLALEATPDNVVSQTLADQLLERVGAVGIVLHKHDNVTLMIDSEMPPQVDATYDLRDMQVIPAIRAAFAALFRKHDRVLRILDEAPQDQGSVVEVLLYEQPLRAEMWQFGRRILELSVIISLITAALVYVSLQWLLVGPMRRITAAIAAFGVDPEDAGRVIMPSGRGDEIGIAQRELANMQETVRQALRQRARLAALGTAVTKINHDLRGILSTALILSDSLAESAAPEVRRVAPTLIAAIDRAVALCTRTLDFTRDKPPPLIRRRFPFADLVTDVAQAVTVPADGDPAADAAPRIRNEVPATLEVEADRDQLYRVLFNLCHNAVEAGAHHVGIAGAAGDDETTIEVRDDGPGLPPKARDNLFQPFTGSARVGGTGLGLAIARELMRAHGGDIVLVETTGAGTVFRLTLPTAPAAQRNAATPPRPLSPASAREPVRHGARQA